MKKSLIICLILSLLVTGCSSSNNTTTNNTNTNSETTNKITSIEKVSDITNIVKEESKEEQKEEFDTNIKENTEVIIEDNTVETTKKIYDGIDIERDDIIFTYDADDLLEVLITLWKNHDYEPYNERVQDCYNQFFIKKLTDTYGSLYWKTSGPVGIVFDSENHKISGCFKMTKNATDYVVFTELNTDTKECKDSYNNFLYFDELANKSREYIANALQINPDQLWISGDYYGSNTLGLVYSGGTSIEYTSDYIKPMTTGNITLDEYNNFNNTYMTLSIHDADLSIIDKIIELKDNIPYGFKTINFIYYFNEPAELSDLKYIPSEIGDKMMSFGTHSRISNNPQDTWTISIEKEHEGTSYKIVKSEYSKYDSNGNNGSVLLDHVPDTMPEIYE